MKIARNFTAYFFTSLFIHTSFTCYYLLELLNWSHCTVFIHCNQKNFYSFILLKLLQRHLLLWKLWFGNFPDATNLKNIYCRGVLRTTIVLDTSLRLLSILLLSGNQRENPWNIWSSTYCNDSIWWCWSQSLHRTVGFQATVQIHIYTEAC